MLLCAQHQRLSQQKNISWENSVLHVWPQPHKVFLVFLVFFLIVKCVRLKIKLFHQRAHRFGHSLANKSNSTVSFIINPRDSIFQPCESSYVVLVFPGFPTCRPKNICFCGSGILSSPYLGKVYSSFSTEISLLLGCHDKWILHIPFPREPFTWY